MDFKNIRNGLVGAALVLAVGLVSATAIAGCYALRMRALANAIDVTGSADRTITSDVVKWHGRITRNVGVDGLKDGNLAMKKDLAAALALMHEAGITDEQITLRPSSVYPTYVSDANGGSRQTGYTVDQSFQAETNDVKGTTKLAQEVSDKMLANGVMFATDGLEYYYSKLGDLKLELIADATKNAKARAEQIAASTGAKLGAARSAGMGVFQVTAVNSTEISDYGAYDTAAIEKKVTAVARASFQLR